VSITINKLIEYCLQNNVEFATYRLPGTSKPVTMIVSNTKSKTGIETFYHDKSTGFVIAPFSDSSSPAVKLIPDLIIEGSVINSSVLNKIPISKNGNKYLNQAKTESSKANYVKIFNEIKKHVDSGSIKKVVLSDTLEMDHLSHCHSALLYQRLLHLYPTAFVYIFNSKQTGTWIGATPETLVSSNNGNFQTMALASTQSYREGKKITWHHKDIEEHGYVRSFIKDKLKKLNIKKIDEGKTENARAGKIVHLKTVFRGNSDLVSPLEIALQLHPTPAVCGTPTERAKELILKTENHNREYYTGFLGPIFYKQSSDLFVNLRCAKLDTTKTVLFAGGGIVKESLPEKEWEEIQLKYNTLLLPMNQTSCEEKSKDKKYAS
jgi:isochorismate synthase